VATERWQLSAAAAANYERYQVPSVFEPLAGMFLQRVALRPGERVLDVACGTGIVTRLAAPILGGGGSIVGVDLNGDMLDVARENASAVGARVDWHQGDATSLPFADAEFDVVLCQQGLQFLPDKPAALAEMHRVLKPEGLLGVCVWCAIEHSPLHAAIAKWIACHISRDVADRFSAPFSLGKPGSLRSAIGTAGFEAAEIYVDTVTRRLLPAEKSVPGLLASTPIADDIAALDKARLADLIDEVSGKLVRFMDGHELVVPQPTQVGIARK
jgi:ubiquinone/menaquinone biosynthesis C-methylase UbiE